MVGEWAYIKELATMSIRDGGEWSLLGSVRGGSVVRDRRRRASIVKRKGKNVTGVLVSRHLLTILYYSLVVAWEVFWASRRSPSPLDPSTEVVLTGSCYLVDV